MDRSTRDYLVNRILGETGDPWTSRPLWESYLRGCSQNDVEIALELLNERRDKIRNAGAWLNRILQATKDRPKGEV